jgi:hypothetical protein
MVYWTASELFRRSYAKVFPKREAHPAHLLHLDYCYAFFRFSHIGVPVVSSRANESKAANNNHCLCRRFYHHLVFGVASVMGNTHIPSPEISHV